jgi:hypothetical protein
MFLSQFSPFLSEKIFCFPLLLSFQRLDNLAVSAFDLMRANVQMCQHPGGKFNVEGGWEGQRGL